jgi:hypothetical protein
VTTPELLAACRAALERQKAVEAAATPGPWFHSSRQDATNYISNGDPEPGRAHGAWDTFADRTNCAETCQARNHDRARLEVAGKLIDSASSAATEMNSSAWTDFYLTFAAQLLGVAVD